MDIISIIGIIVAILVLYVFLRFIVSPIIKAVIGVLIFFVFIYLLQRLFGFNLNQILAPFGISFDISHWGLNLNWIMTPINYFVDQFKNLLNIIWANVPKFNIPN
jgi:hypothetical protein